MKNFNFFKIKLSFFIVFFFFMAIEASSQTHASYPLLSSLEDVTCNYGDINLQGTPAPTPPSPGNPLCVAGNIFLGGNLARTPAITSLDPTDFSIKTDFRISDFGTPRFTGGNPVLMLSFSWRMIGIEVNSTTGQVGMLWNNINYSYSNTILNLDEWYTGEIRFLSGTAELYINGALVHTEVTGALNFGSVGVFDISTNNGGNGGGFTGCIQNLLVTGPGAPAGCTTPTPCQTFDSGNDLAIPDNTPGGVDIPIVVSGSGTPVSDVNISLDITHTWVGDLSATLTSPNGTTVTLFDRAGNPALFFGCAGDNLNVTFDDGAADSYVEFENTCGNLPAISGDFQPFSLLSAFNGEDPNGTWTLNISDNAAGDTGDLNIANLEICAGTGTGCVATVTCPNPATFDCGEDISAWLNSVQFENCGDGMIMNNYDPDDFDKCMTTTNPITFSLVNAAGQTVADCVTQLTINAADAPTPASILFVASVTCEEAAAFVAPNLPYSNNLVAPCDISGTIPPTVQNNWDACGGQIVISYDGQDECGNPLSSGPFMIDVDPAPVPTITPPAYSSPMSCADAANFSIGEATYTNGLTGLCEISGTIPAAFDDNWDACGGNITVYYFGVDDCGNQIVHPPLILMVQPAPIPAITLPALPASLACGDAGSYMPPSGAFDNGLPGVCNLSGTATAAINNFYDECGGYIELIYQGTDACGRNIPKNITTIPVDPAPAPMVDVPDYPSTLTCGEAEALLGKYATYSNGFDGPCKNTGFLEPTVVKNVNACSGGTITISYNGTDNCGNILSATPVVISVSPAPVPTVYLSDDPLSMQCHEAIGFYPSPATYTNGENEFCENSGELNLTTFDNNFWNECDGGYILLQFSGFDNCGNYLETDLYKIAVAPDFIAPQGTCTPFVTNIEDIKLTPEPDDLDYYKYMVGLNYYDYCNNVNVTVVGDSGFPVCGLEGTFSRVYDVEISDDCGNVAGNCSIIFQGNCNPYYCNLSEEFYSNPDEEFGGYTSLGMITELIGNGANPISVGSDDCGFTLDDASCIQTALAGEGQSISLPSGYDLACGEPSNNNLVNQIITTTLNIRYNAQLNGNGLDYGNFQINAACIYCPALIKDALPDNPTINDLLDYANGFIGCQCTGECGNYDNIEADITNILLGLNSRFNKCHVPGPCYLENETPETLFPSIGETNANIGNDADIFEVTIFPNPASEIINVELKEVKGQAGTIIIYDAQGRKIATQSYISLDQNKLRLEVKNFTSGLYWLSINVDGYEQVTKRFVVK